MIDPTDVRTRDDLVRYLDGLARAVSLNQREVEMVRIEDFLEALAAWIADMDGYFANQGVEPPSEGTWQVMAMAVAAGLVYE
ncbi:hypothetical protein KEM60_00183 [Austwickia sp. TVS 96-490-7B]|uniref:DUF7660 family protein n=1 Tax=Austwickia sp. TVS 96-490-7B TaxID=2830843 RepID=UPI001C56B3A8|nr:hypothetical protein [Austwickia sp. TVS 96-490-7B]MBW3084000.1 hypothetical protein [Austwickia sp. TVS 96-490-7B]